MMKTTLFTFIFSAFAMNLFAQTFGLEYTGELQTDFKRAKMANLLQLNAEIPFAKKFSFSLSSVSVASTDTEPLIDDLQGYSNIDAQNIPFALSVAGFSWNVNEHHSLFAGIRRMDEDYFCSEVLSLFTNSSAGIFPTISANYDIATYPCASVGIHYIYNKKNLTFQSSLYNGTGYYKFSGRENAFRFAPKTDGIFGLAQTEYRYKGSRYYWGTSLHYSDLMQTSSRNLRPTVWGYAEQALPAGFTLLAAYSHAFSSDNVCRNYCAIGGKYTYKKAELGICSDYTCISGVNEFATELTGCVALTEYLSLQPAMHFVTTGGRTKCIGMLRTTISL